MNIRIRTQSHTQHYFHFLYGYIIPFVNRFDPSNNLYLFDSCGPVMNQIILGLDKYQIEIYDGHQFDSEFYLDPHDNKDFIGLNIDLTRKRMFSLIESEPNSSKKDILVIYRENPDPFYINEAEREGSGSSRRSIPNIFEIHAAVSQKIPKCKILALEGMSLKDQIITFRDASCVILQHGAAMANLIWCRPGTLVIEIGPEDEISYYNKLVKMLKLRRHQVVQDHAHAAVDFKTIVDLVCKKTVLL